MPVKRVDVALYQGVIKGMLFGLGTKEITRVTLKILNRSMVMCPVDQGNLRAAHQFRIKETGQRVTGEVFNKVKYALPVHEGRGPLTIRPKHRQALAFVWHGQPMVRKSVFQPARKGRPWMRDALKEVAGHEGYKVMFHASDI